MLILTDSQGIFCRRFSTRDETRAFISEATGEDCEVLWLFDDAEAWTPFEANDECLSWVGYWREDDCHLYVLEIPEPIPDLDRD